MVTIYVTGVDLAASVITPYDHKVVRGFNSSLTVNLSVTNIDTDDEVIDVPAGRYNFNVSIGIFSTNTSGDGQNCLQWLIIDKLITDPLALNQSLQLKIETVVNIPRSKCSSYKYVCGFVHPGIGSSYTKGAADKSTCLDLSSMRPCGGTSCIK